MKGSNKREAFAFYMLIMPFIVMLLLIKVIPFISGVCLSFTNYSGYNLSNLKFVKFNNYIRLFSDGDALYALYRTVFISVINVPLSIIIGLLLALVLNTRIKGVSIFRTLFYIPSIVPVVAAGQLWYEMYDKSQGLFNIILGQFGMKAVDWLGYERVTSSLIVMLLWFAGGSILVNIAALKGVPAELYEASHIDGASALIRFRNIMLPLITPILYFNLITGIIGSLQLFAQSVMLSYLGTKNGITAVPLKPTYTYMVHVYQQLFVNQRFGYGLALVWIFFAFIMILTLLITKTSKYWVYSEVGQDGGD